MWEYLLLYVLLFAGMFGSLDETLMYGDAVASYGTFSVLASFDKRPRVASFCSTDSGTAIIRQNPSLRCDASCAAYFPLDVLDADLVSRLLIVVVPVAFAEVNVGELRPRLDACRFPVAIGLELNKFQSSAVQRNDVLCLCWFLLRVDLRGIGNVC